MLKVVVPILVGTYLSSVACDRKFVRQHVLDIVLYYIFCRYAIIVTFVIIDTVGYACYIYYCMVAL